MKWKEERKRKKLKKERKEKRYFVSELTDMRQTSMIIYADLHHAPR